MISPLLLHNHEIRPSSDLFFTPGQVGLLNGWGVFSTIKVVDGVLFAFQRHWARMRRDAELMRVPFPWSPEELESSLLRLVEANRDFNSTLRVAVLRNKGSLWESPGLVRDIELVAFTAQRNQWAESVRLGIVPNARFAASPFASAKITSWALNLIWYEQAHVSGLDEVILLNEHSRVAECTSANVFAVFGNDALTPPISEGCLPGVTRELLLEAVHCPGIQVREQPLTLDDLQAADGLFITSSTRDLLPVASVEGLSIRTGDTLRPVLLAEYHKYEQQYVRMANKRASLLPTGS